jgi:tRNA pseudouridine32 synthase/23S rRNA pseudouridine746 synthase
MPRSPLPPREGISATALRAPGGRATHAKNHLPVPATIGDWLESEFPEAAPEPRRSLLTDGDMRDEAGLPVAWDDPVVPGGFYFFHRPVPPEERIPFEVGIVFEDDDLLVVDKPHFLASTPNGRFVRECVVTRLRVDLGQPDLVAIHRLDRITAGLLVLSKRPETRGRYQRLFQDRRVSKTYRALAPAPPPELEFPLVRESRLVKPVGGRQVHEVAGEPNAVSRIRLLRTITTRTSVSGAAWPPQREGSDHEQRDRWEGERGAPPRRGDSDVDPRDRTRGEDEAPPRRGVAEYELEPVTGKTHQLRVHMNALGLPILGDPVYPVDLAPDPYDFSSPLQLLAAKIEFDDPLTGLSRRFESGLELDPAAVSSDPGETR